MVFLLFTEGGLYIYNAAASALNVIVNQIIHPVFGEITWPISIWTSVVIDLIIAANAICLSFG